MSVSPDEVSQANKDLAKFVAGVFGGHPRVHVYNHDYTELSMPVLSAPACPGEFVTSYSTIGLSDSPMLQHGREFPTRVELAGICLTRHAEHFGNVLATLAFAVMRASLFIYPGAHLQDFVNYYYPGTTVPHIYFWDPHFFWDDRLTTTKFGDKTVSWLLAMPMSEPERQYLLAHGEEEFEKLIDRKGVDMYHLWRDPSLEGESSESEDEHATPG